jgi:type IV pilus assembly protein PilB
VLSQQDFIVGALSEEGLLKPEVLERATRYASEHQVPVTDALVALGAVTARDLAIVRAVVCECPFVDLEHYDVDLRNAALLPRSVAERNLAFPLFNQGRSVTLALADPMDFRAVDQVRTLLKADVEPVLAEPGALRTLIERAYSITAGVDQDERPDAAPTFAETQGAEAQPIVAAVNQIIAQAVEQRASDVHIGPDENALHLRYRVDGELAQRQGPPLSSHPGIVQRIKVMAGLDLTQTRRPQDGKFRFVHAGQPVDIRVSIIPTICGENVVMRLPAAHRFGSPRRSSSRTA